MWINWVEETDALQHFGSPKGRWCTLKKNKCWFLQNVNEQKSFREVRERRLRWLGHVLNMLEGSKVGQHGKTIMEKISAGVLAIRERKKPKETPKKRLKWSNRGRTRSVDNGACVIISDWNRFYTCQTMVLPDKLSRYAKLVVAHRSLGVSKFGQDITYTVRMR